MTPRKGVDLQPVHIKEPELHKIEVLRLDVDDEGQVMLNPEHRYHEFGTVKMATKVRQGLFVTEWTGFGPRGDVTGATKREVIELLLEKHGFYEAGPNATIPPLF